MRRSLRAHAALDPFVRMSDNLHFHFLLVEIFSVVFIYLINMNASSFEGAKAGEKRRGEIERGGDTQWKREP